MHYHVVENSPGCLPESDQTICATRKDAEQAAASRARELRTDGWDVLGKASDGYYFACRPLDSMEQVIEIIRCTEARYDCLIPAQEVA